MDKIMKTGRVTLAVLLLAVLASNIVLMLLVRPQPVQAETLDTYHAAWKLIRETADEDGSDFLATYNLPIQGNFGSKDTSTVANGGAYPIRRIVKYGVNSDGYSEGGAWIFALCAKNYDVGSDNTIDNTFSFNIVGWSTGNGMLQVIAEGDCILGTQAVITYPIDSSDALDTDAVGVLIDMTGVAYTHSDTTFTKTDVGIGVVAGMMIYTTSSNESNLTTGYYAVTSRTDDTIVATTGSSGNATATVQSNPAFWADTINLDETTKWPSVAVYNSGDNEVGFIVVDTTGIEWIQFVIYDALPVQTLEAGDVTVYGRPY